jgi:hypothetical protein
MNAKTRRRLRQRRYDTGPHRKIRKGLAPLVAAGLATCARCGEPIEPRSKWDLGHTDDLTAVVSKRLRYAVYC